MNEEKRKNLIENYIHAYNSFDVDAMTMNLDDEIVFRNISGGETTLELKGIDAFRNQAEQVVSFFAEREQKITGFINRENECEVEIDYRATFAADLPDAFKKGDRIELKGRSIFRFSDAKISEIEDIS